MRHRAWIGRVSGFVAAFGLLAVVGLSVTVVAAFGERRALQQHAQTLNQNAANLIIRGLADRLVNVRGDALALAQPWMVEQALAAPSVGISSRVERFFSVLIASRQDYARIRLLNADGREVVQVERDNSANARAATAARESLDPSMVSAISALDRGQVLVSPLELGNASAPAGQPAAPSFRVGTPVFADSGRRIGALLINFDGRHLLERMEADARLAHGSVWLTDLQGHWILGPGPARASQMVVPGQPRPGLARDFPDVWSAVRRGGAGALAGTFGLLTHAELTFPGDGAATPPGMRVIILAPRPTLAGIMFNRAHLLIYALSLPILLILAGLLSHLRVRLAGAQGEVAANSRLLQDIFDHSNLSMKVKDLRGRIVRANAMAGRLLGRPPEELLGQTIDSVATEETAALVRSHDREVIETGRVTTYEEQVAYLGGTYTLLTTRFPVTDEHGRVAGIGALSVDITPRIRMEEWLRLSRDEAEAANVAKAAFLANMSHELRTPLNSIIGLGELLLEQAQEEAGDALSVESLQRVVGAGRHLLALINDILDISRVEAGHVELSPEPVLITTLIDNVLSSLQPLARSNGNTLDMEMVQDPGIVLVDPMRVRQVLLNLVGNAIKFTRDGAVTVRVGRDEHTVQIAVIDTGPGMTAEQMERIFKPFEQADRSIARRFGGTGLGLAISRQLTELMQGEIEVNSTPGEGSVFTLTLPAGPFQAPSAQMPDMMAPSAERPHSSRVLVVDDDDDARNLLCTTLERLGLEVMTATSGLEALARVRSERPAVMLLDILLGDMSGWDVLTLLRADPVHVDLPVILCTVTDPDHRTASLGVIEHLTKPIDRDRLSSLVRRFTASDGPSRVLVVDDDDHYREQLAMVLRREGHRVRMASGGEQALQQMRQETPELVLLDLLMPGMDGLAVIAAMRSDPRLACTQVVLVTAADVPADLLDQVNRRAIMLMRKGEADLNHIAARARELVERVGRPAEGQGE